MKPPRTGEARIRAEDGARDWRPIAPFARGPEKPGYWSLRLPEAAGSYFFFAAAFACCACFFFLSVLFGDLSPMVFAGLCPELSHLPLWIRLAAYGQGPGGDRVAYSHPRKGVLFLPV
jgi:hypothetical protein